MSNPGWSTTPVSKCWFVKCAVCGEQVQRNASGVFRHTTAASSWPRKNAEICAGSTRGARP